MATELAQIEDLERVLSGVKKSLAEYWEDLTVAIEAGNQTEVEYYIERIKFCEARIVRLTNIIIAKTKKSRSPVQSRQISAHTASSNRSTAVDAKEKGRPEVESVAEKQGCSSSCMGPQSSAKSAGFLSRCLGSLKSIVGQRRLYAGPDGYQPLGGCDGPVPPPKHRGVQLRCGDKECR